MAALSPLAVLLGAGIAGYMVWRTVKQKGVADNRAEWWKRTQCGLDSVYSGDKKSCTVGLKFLKVLGESELAESGGLAALGAAWERTLNEAERIGAHAAASPEAEAEAAEIVGADERAMEGAAAQLRLVTDRRLGKITPDWVKAQAAPRRREVSAAGPMRDS